MNLFEGKSPAERNKIIAVSVLGVLALLTLGYSIIGNPFASKKKTTVSVSTTPTPKTSSTATSQTAVLPSNAEMDITYTTTPIVYNPNRFYAPDAGRNIFAFYEPPPPTPWVPTPTPQPPPVVIVTPTPPIPPPLLVGFITPQSVYAGSKTFRLEVNGDKFTTDSMIILNGSQLPTTYVSPQKLVADVPSNFISGAGQLFVIVRTPDGKLYSNQVSLNIQAPPTPQFQYIGMIARQKFNNDTAYFQEPGKPTPFGARLNDVVAGRFRLASISSGETIFEDVNLGFKHRLAIQRPANGQTGGVAGGTVQQNPGLSSPGRIPAGKGVYNPNDLNSQPVPIQQGDCPPGIPCGDAGRIVIQQPQMPQEKKDEDDDGNNRK